MATLLLASHTSPGVSSPSLRTWLREGWAILFSHPDDFVSYDLEMDRWLVITRRAFAERRVRPIALAAPTLDPNHSWVMQVSGDHRTVLLEDPAQQHLGWPMGPPGPVDLQTPVLREAIEQPGRRFVMIIDSALRIQKTFTYQGLSNLPSPLELLGWAEALRVKQAATTANAETNSRSAPHRHAHPLFAARRHKHRIPQIACEPGIHARAG